MLSGWPKSRLRPAGLLDGYKRLTIPGNLDGFPRPIAGVLNRADPINLNLVRYWPMNEGRGSTMLDLAYSTLATIPASGYSWSAGVKRSAALLAAGSNTVTTANPTASELPSGASPKSMSIWLRTSSVAGAYAWGAAYGQAGGSQTHMIGRNGTTLFGAFYANDLTVSNFWAIGDWHHVVLTYDGTTAFLYGDGALRAQGAKTLNTIKNQFYIGNMVSGPEYWLGDITQLRFYARCLSQYDVTQLFINPWAGVL